MDSPFKRKSTDRKVEAKRASKNISSNDIIGAKLGINRAGRNYDKIQFELNRNKHNLKQLGIDESALKEFGL
jgi:hypothetical protein